MNLSVYPASSSITPHSGFEAVSCFIKDKKLSLASLDCVKFLRAMMAVIPDFALIFMLDKGGQWLLGVQLLDLQKNKI